MRVLLLELAALKQIDPTRAAGDDAFVPYEKGVFSFGRHSLIFSLPFAHSAFVGLRSVRFSDCFSCVLLYGLSHIVGGENRVWPESSIRADSTAPLATLKDTSSTLVIEASLFVFHFLEGGLFAQLCGSPPSVFYPTVLTVFHDRTVEKLF